MMICVMRLNGVASRTRGVALHALPFQQCSTLTTRPRGQKESHCSRHYHHSLRTPLSGPCTLSSPSPRLSLAVVSSPAVVSRCRLSPSSLAVASPSPSPRLSAGRRFSPHRLLASRRGRPPDVKVLQSAWVGGHAKVRHAKGLLQQTWLRPRCMHARPVIGI